MITFPNAKINLGLSVVAKRTDGYHDLETVFYPIALKDALEIVKSDLKGCHLSVSGLQVDGDPQQNLIVKAYSKMQERFDLSGVDAYLYKHIPFGAGLGGGSADAAFMLQMLRSVFDLPVSDVELEDMSAELGADCPFFCRNQPVFATGTGNQFSPITISLKGYYLAIVKPPVSVPTKDAFADICPARPIYSLREIVETYPVEQWRNYLKNDFEKTVFKRYPQIGELKERLYQAGAVYASMSGSGSALFGLFKKPVDLRSIFPKCFVWLGACEI